ncbi:flagellar motor switch phosphatase FliY [Sporolactobacillus sp. THM7-4]|nr:flagellar motor switch phosphatase FliY [Sporolactobacillus sp. THM7-4]
MNDGQLSQEEIDALLGRQSEMQKKQEPDQQQEPPDESSATLINRDYMSEIQEDVLGEIGNISFGSAATALSTILNQKVEITTPVVQVVSKKNLGEEFPVPYVSVLVNYTEGFQGSCVLVIKTRDAGVIADLMMGGDGRNPSTSINEMEMSAVQEAMNQMMGSSSTAMSTVFNRRIDISPPELTLMDVRTRMGIDHIPDDDKMFEISFRLKIGSLVDSHIMQLIPIQFGKQLADLLLSESGKNGAQQVAASDQGKTAVPENGDNPEQEASLPVAGDQSHAPSENRNSDTGPLPKNQGPDSSKADESPVTPNAVDQRDVRPAEFLSFDDEPEAAAKSVPRNLNLLMDIPLDVSVELGRTQKTVKEVLELGPGSIIELDRLAGEAIDILVNQKCVAKGEVVVVDENFGIRITEILNHYDRIKDL